MAAQSPGTAAHFRGTAVVSLDMTRKCSIALVFVDKLSAPRRSSFFVGSLDPRSNWELTHGVLLGHIRICIMHTYTYSCSSVGVDHVKRFTYTYSNKLRSLKRPLTYVLMIVTLYTQGSYPRQFTVFTRSDFEK